MMIGADAPSEGKQIENESRSNMIRNQLPRASGRRTGGAVWMIASVMVHSVSSRPVRSATMRTMMLALAVACAVSLAVVAPAMANQAKGLFKQFNQCPISDSNVEVCIVLKINGGRFNIGTASVPINKRIVFQGGEDSSGNFIGAENGETLTKVPLSVPGGLVGVVGTPKFSATLEKRYEEVRELGLTAVTATLELVGTPVFSTSNLAQEQGVALSLPVRIHLENTFLGSACYVGSSATPIAMELTTGSLAAVGKNPSISGAAGTLQSLDGGELLIFKGDELVDNAFTEPIAEGCGGSFYAFEVDPAIDFKLSLPAATGNNEVVIEDIAELATAYAVKTS
jgi:hypothetical protein